MDDTSFFKMGPGRLRQPWSARVLNQFIR